MDTESRNGVTISIKSSKPAVIENSKFFNIKTGGVLADETNLNMTNCVFRNVTKSSITINSLANVSVFVLSSIFETNPVNHDNYGGGINTKCLGSINITNNTFKGLHGFRGGALYLSSENI